MLSETRAPPRRFYSIHSAGFTWGITRKLSAIYNNFASDTGSVESGNFAGAKYSYSALAASEETFLTKLLVSFDSVSHHSVLSYLRIESCLGMF